MNNLLCIILSEQEIPLTLTAEQNNSTVLLSKIGNPVVEGIQYRTNDDLIWRDYIIDIDTKNTNIKYGITIILQNIGDYVQFRNINNTLSTSDQNYVQFIMSGKINGSGNIQSMLHYSNICTPYCYTNMFYGCRSLTNAPQLPATTLANSCYSSMFSGCSSLINAPKLPATTLAENCYHIMFGGCRSLTNAPQLPATTLANSCYSSMFSGCSSLIAAPQLPATELAQNCYYSMFNNCRSLTNAPQLPATELAQNCYYSMFNDCRSLTNAPSILPAITLTSYCYNNMFYNTKVDRIEVNFTQWNPSNATPRWLYNASLTGTFIKPSALQEIRDSNHIPSGWTIINK